MHPILRIFDYQYDASLSVIGSTESYGHTVGILGSDHTCNTIGCLTVQISAFDVLGIGQCHEYESVEDESCQHVKYAFNCIYQTLPDTTRFVHVTSALIRLVWSGRRRAYQLLPFLTMPVIWLDPAHRSPLPTPRPGLVIEHILGYNGEGGGGVGAWARLDTVADGGGGRHYKEVIDTIAEVAF